MYRPPATVVQVGTRTEVARWIGVFTAENYGRYAPGDITSPHHRIPFDTIDDAAHFLDQIVATGHDPRTGTSWLDVRPGDHLDIYRAFRVAEQDAGTATDIWPTHRLIVGPRQGVKVERI